MTIKKSTGIFLVLLIALSLAVPSVFAGSPHFTNVDVTRTSGTSITVSGKEAGLGNETSVHIEVTADALCINPGSHHPKAANKESLTGGGDFPVQNGKALFEVSLTATFDPDCSPPMTVVFTNIVVCDTNHDVCTKVSGTY